MMDTTRFDECFLFRVITERQSYRCPEVWCNYHVAALFETSILKKVSILYLLFPQ